VSQITDGSPVIQINVGPGVDLRYVTLSNFTIEGNGREGDGIRIVADGNDRWMYCWTLENVTVQHVGGFGLDVQGSVFEGIVSNSWMIANAQGGASFAHSDGGGQVSALRWFGGGFQDNGGAGLLLDKGARDISVDGVSFAHNTGAGISAASGITSVSDSDFQDNGGVGVWFQNFGNFNDNTFASSGAQAVGISGYLAGGATLVGNSSTYTGAGADTTALASLQGNGAAFLTDDSGKVVTGQNVAVSGAGGGNLTHVTVSTDGVDLAAPAPVAAITTAAVANSSGTGVLETALKAALAGGTVAHLTDTSYVVTSSIVINITASFQGPLGIDLGGAKILSQIAGGGPVIQINIGAGVDIGTLTLSNFSIQGNGLEGDGIKIVADGADRWIRDLDIRNVDIEHVGGIGLDVLGNVQGSVFDSWMHGNGQGGARIANSAGGGVADHLEWVGGGFRKNDVAGLILDNGAHDLTIQGAYFVDNQGPGIQATSGITLVRQSGFENNLGTGAIVEGAASFADVTFSTWGVQTVGIGGYLTADQVSLLGIGSEYYGTGANPTVLANLQG
ncbi:MAG TPA: right-handed parallel beta-helix repeat-containing protein, partial [Reyranella sp.]